MTTSTPHCSLPIELTAKGDSASGGAMKARLLFGAVALALALAACGSQGPSPTEVAAPAKSISDLPAYEQIQPRRVRAAGACVHRWSGMTLPATIGQLKRVEIVQFDSAALDVSGDYQLASDGGRALVTVYIYPTNAALPAPPQSIDEGCRAEFDGVKQVLIQRFPGAGLVREWREDVPRFNGAAAGYAAAFDLTGNLLGPTEPLRSEAYLFCGIGGLWNVKYRVSFSRSLAGTPVAEDAIMSAPTAVPQ